MKLSRPKASANTGSGSLAKNDSLICEAWAASASRFCATYAPTSIVVVIRRSGMPERCAMQMPSTDTRRPIVSASANPFGVLAGDLAGFPNGRRVTDDVVSIALRAVAGVTFALVDKNFKPDNAATILKQGLCPANV